MSEDKITIKTFSRFYSRKNGYLDPALTFASLLAAITEVYAQANEIGWETKCLDDLNAWILNAYRQADED